ncbi:UTP--glucose-1-phosphate uridylyltransferase [Streptomyces sp. CBG30]|uniref:UTP--glucose-1-phosphate uridylyltransferase n=1 Tax=Streptomyces sp. CBG30 TaxID=2838869 RepID=UPI001BEA9573|nr:sugar phosphate nucleotidyltransferase [Streptomyces sp. CBG30]MBT3095685.1 UTP--glucose-1-phosphate uridylyltransferase [Streptomyces sp. CBG30]
MLLSSTAAIQYVVRGKLVAAGLSDVLMITGRNKRPMEDHFDRNYELESALQKKGDADRLARSGVQRPGHHAKCGRATPRASVTQCSVPPRTWATSPIAVLLGDDLIDPRDPLLARMVEIQEREGGSVVALMEVDPAQVHLYGCAAADATVDSDVVRVTGLVEKPEPADAPSNLAVIGRYVLDPAVFDILRHTEPGRGGEIQLTDALQLLAQDEKIGGPVHGVVFKGRRYDTGDPQRLSPGHCQTGVRT